MSLNAVTGDTRNAPKNFVDETNHADFLDSGRKPSDIADLNGHSPSSEVSSEVNNQRKGKSREESAENLELFQSKDEDESDEEGEVKDLGAARDLREEIEAKRVRRQVSKPPVMNHDIKRLVPPLAEGSMPCLRREAMIDENVPNNGFMGRHCNDMRRPEFRRGLDPQLPEIRRRIPSPDSFRLRRSSPSRRPSPGLRGMGRSCSPRRAIAPVFFGENRPHEGRFATDGRVLARDSPRDMDFRERQSPARFHPGPAFSRDGGVVSRSCSIRVRNLPPGPPPERLKADIVDFFRLGRISDLLFEYRGNERHAIITFPEPIMAEDARRHMNRTNFHGAFLDAEIEQVLENSFRRRPEDREGIHMPAFQEEMDDPCSNCRIIVDDIDEKLLDAEILTKFKTFGPMETFDLHRERGRVFAIIRFRSLSSAVRARREMHGQLLGDRRCRIDYRFADPTCELWVGGVHMSVTDADMSREFSRYGRISKLRVNRANKCAYVVFERVDDAAAAAAGMRGRMLGSASWKLKVDFADRAALRSHSPGPARCFGRAGPAKPPSHSGAEGVGSMEAFDAASRPPSHGPVHKVESRSESGHKAAATEIPSASEESAIRNRGKRGREESSADGEKEVQPSLEKKQVSASEKKTLSLVVEVQKPISVLAEAPTPAAQFPPIDSCASLDCLSARGGGPAESDPKEPEAKEPEGPPSAAPLLPASQIDVDPTPAVPTPPAEGGEVGEVDPLDRFAELWRGEASVKGAGAVVALRKVQCGEALAREMLAGDRLVVTQRMRLVAEVLSDFLARLREQGEEVWGVLLGLPATADQGARLRQHLVSYLVQRNVAGVARVEGGMVYLFPPNSALVAETEALRGVDLSRQPDHLLAVLVRDTPPR